MRVCARACVVCMCVRITILDITYYCINITFFLHVSFRISSRVMSARLGTSIIHYRHTGAHVYIQTSFNKHNSHSSIAAYFLLSSLVPFINIHQEFLRTKLTKTLLFTYKMITLSFYI